VYPTCIPPKTALKTRTKSTGYGGADGTRTYNLRP
jgi:hypothetical protein